MSPKLAQPWGTMVSTSPANGGASVSFEGEPMEACHRCGAPLGGDLDDEPDGGVDGLPICGECVRNRDEAADFEAMDLVDGELDGVIDF